MEKLLRHVLFKTLMTPIEQYGLEHTYNKLDLYLKYWK